MAETSDLLTIGQFSTLCRISVRMLRHYDEHGVITPAQVEPFTGYRFYRADQVGDAVFARRLRDAGFGVSAIAGLMATPDIEVRRRALHLRREELDDDLTAVRERIRCVESLLEENDMHMQENAFAITTRTEPPRTVVGLRGVIPHYWDEPMLWQQLDPLLTETGTEAVGPCGATMHDDGYKDVDVDVEVWAPVAEAVDVPEPAICHEIPAHRVLVARVEGPFALIGPACGELARHVASEGLTPAGRMFNLYLVSPDDGVTEQEYVTEVCLPIV